MAIALTRLSPLRWLLLFGLALTLGCERQDATLDIIERASNHFYQQPAYRISEEIDRALAIGADGPADMRETINRFRIAKDDSDAPGAVKIVIEASRFSETAIGENPRSRTVQLHPTVVDGKLSYIVRINSSLYQFGPDGPPTLAMFLYAVELRREFNEQIRQTSGYDGDRLMDALIAQPDGLLAAHYATWNKVIENVYLPWRQSGKLRTFPAFDRYLADRATCPKTQSTGDCLRALTRSLVGL